MPSKYSPEYYRKNKERIKQYRENNRELIKEINRRSYEKHKERRAEDCKEYREQNGDKIKEISKQYYELNKAVIAEKHKAYYPKFYLANAVKIQAYGQKYAKENRAKLTANCKANRKKRADWFWELKQRYVCPCGERHPAALDFHHRDPKAKEGLVSRMVNDAATEKRILAEIKKCDVICANCHRKLHCKREWKANQ